MSELLDTSSAFAGFWQAWLSVRTGMPGGSTKMNPRRDERPVQFWFVVAFYIGAGVLFGAEGWGLL